MMHLVKTIFPFHIHGQMLERISGNGTNCFLDGFSGYFQIPIDPLDQEKTTFTCPYGTFAYRRMLLGYALHRARSQRCMVAIFHDMFKEKSGSSSWMFSQVLGHKISKSGIEVDKAKVDVIAKLPHPTTVKEAFDILKAFASGSLGGYPVPVHRYKDLRFWFLWAHDLQGCPRILSPDVTAVK
ncbi:hypothetical protein Tco_0623086 [Tanacetum coccineum]